MTRDGSGIDVGFDFDFGLGIELRPERNTGYGANGDYGILWGYGDGFGSGDGSGRGKGRSSWGFWLHGYAQYADDVWRKL